MKLADEVDRDVAEQVARIREEEGFTQSAECLRACIASARVAQELHVALTDMVNVWEAEDASDGEDEAPAHVLRARAALAKVQP